MSLRQGGDKDPQVFQRLASQDKIWRPLLFKTIRDETVSLFNVNVDDLLLLVPFSKATGGDFIGFFIVLVSWFHFPPSNNYEMSILFRSAAMTTHWNTLYPLSNLNLTWAGVDVCFLNTFHTFQREIQRQRNSRNKLYHRAISGRITCQTEVSQIPKPIITRQITSFLTLHFQIHIIFTFKLREESSCQDESKTISGIRKVEAVG